MLRRLVEGMAGLSGGGGGGRHWQRPPSLMSWQTVGAKYGVDLEEKGCLVHQGNDFYLPCLLNGSERL